MQERNLGGAAIEHREASCFQDVCEDVALIIVAIGEVCTHWHPFEQLEGAVELQGLMGLIDPDGLHDLRQCRQPGAVHQGNRARDVVQMRGGLEWSELGAQRVDHAGQQGGVKDRGGFRQRPQGGTRAPQRPLDFAQVRGVLEPTEARDNGMEKVQQHERGILLIVAQTFLALIALTPRQMPPLQEGKDGLQVFAARKIVVVNWEGIHAVRMPAPREARKPVSPLTEEGQII